VSARRLRQVGSRPHTTLHRARRGKALRAEGLLQVCWRRHAALQGAWRGKALPARGLLEVSSRRHASLRGAWRGPALRARGLPQGNARRDAVLCGAWRGQALPARRLPQVCARRHASLRGAWRGPALRARGLLQARRSSSRQCVLHALSLAAARRRGGAASPLCTQLARTRGDPDTGGELLTSQFTAEARHGPPNIQGRRIDYQCIHSHDPTSRSLRCAFSLLVRGSRAFALSQSCEQ
jgi:hypothetical protein